MNYTKKQCLFFLKNTKLLEKTPELVETVQAALFKAINARVEAARRLEGVLRAGHR